MILAWDCTFKWLSQWASSTARGSEDLARQSKIDPYQL